MQFKLAKVAMSVLSISALTMTASAYSAEQEENVEVIQVKGIAGSMAESARQKRFNVSISDAIVAEDIGKFVMVNFSCRNSKRHFSFQYTFGVASCNQEQNAFCGNYKTQYIFQLHT